MTTWKIVNAKDSAGKPEEILIHEEFVVANPIDVP